MFPFIWLSTKNTVGSVGAPSSAVKLVLGHGDVSFSVAMDAAAEVARGLALDFFAPFFVVVFTIDEFRSGLAPDGL